MKNDHIREVGKDRTSEAWGGLLKSMGLSLQVTTSGELGRVPYHGILALTKEVE